MHINIKINYMFFTQLLNDVQQLKTFLTLESFKSVDILHALDNFVSIVLPCSVLKVFIINLTNCIFERALKA